MRASDAVRAQTGFSDEIAVLVGEEAMAVMDEADIEQMIRIDRAFRRLGQAPDLAEHRRRRQTFDKLCRDAWVKDDSPDWVVGVVLDARLRREAASGRSWSAKVWPLVKSKVDPIWLERHARERLRELAQPDAPLANCNDPRVRLALMAEDEKRRAALDARASARARRSRQATAF